MRRKMSWVGGVVGGKKQDPGVEDTRRQIAPDVMKISE